MKIEYNQPSSSPVPKVKAAGVGGAVSAVIIFIVSTLWPNIEISAEVGAAFATLVSFFSAYMTRDEKPIEAVSEITDDNYKQSLRG